jgi:hypothetical protein
MFRKFAAIALISGSSIVGLAGVATAQTTPAPKAPNPLKCVGAPDLKSAQALRLQALNAELAGLNARFAVAQANNKVVRVAQIQANIAKVNARVAQVQANQIRLATRCP